MACFKFNVDESRLSGFITLEILLTIFIGTLLTTAALRGYANFQKDLYFINALVSVQERERFLVHLFNERIQLAGDMHCLSEPMHHISAIYTTQDSDNDVLIIEACRFYQRRWQFLKTKYFIANFSLYERVADGHRLELMAGIKNMRILIKDWQVVKGVQITFTLNSPPLSDKKLYLYVTLREPL